METASSLGAERATVNVIDFTPVSPSSAVALVIVIAGSGHRFGLRGSISREASGAPGQPPISAQVAAADRLTTAAWSDPPYGPKSGCPLMCHIPCATSYTPMSVFPSPL